MVEITCIGELLVDKIAEEDGNLKENDKYVKRAGGAPANVAVAASRMGAEVSLAASVGEDEFGEFLLERMKDEGIRTHRIEKREPKTTLAFAALDENASPHFSFYRGADERIERSQLQGIDSEIVHVGSLPFTCEETVENIFSALESVDARISFDPNIRPELMSQEYRERLEEMIEYTDILFAAEDEIEFFGGVKNIREKVEEILVTRGSEGAELIDDETRKFCEAPDTEPVDTTGAGDAFTGAYLAYRREGREEALRKGVDAASISITEKGAMSALPSRQELN